ncbi:MAG: DUF4148 domain-containing protein [Caldimonas sp.]
MNSKLLYAATVALALASGLAMADEGQPVTHDQVANDWNQAVAAGTVRKNDYDYDKYDARALSTRTRDEVLADMKASRPPKELLGPLRNRTFNPAGMETLRVSSLPRADVKAQVVAAVHEGTLRHSDYDDMPVRARRVTERVSAPVLAKTGPSLSSGS